MLLTVLNFAYIWTIDDAKGINRHYAELDSIDASQLKIVFFGDSHPTFSVNPAYINNSYNLAEPSETYEQTYYRVRWVLENMPLVNVFVLNYDLHSFNSYRDGQYAEKRPELNFMTYSELSAMTNTSIPSLLIATKLPLVGKGKEIITFAMSDVNKTELALGWRKSVGEFTKKNMTAVGKGRVDSQLKGYPDIVDAPFLDAFFATLELLKEHDKTVVLVKYPLSDAYLDAVAEKGLNVTAFYAKLNQSFSGANIPILDYQELYRYNASLFADSDHLTPEGSTLFSQRLARDLD